MSPTSTRLRIATACLCVLLASITSLSLVSAQALRSPQTIPTPSFPQQVIELVNNERAEAGLPPLKVNDALSQTAQSHSQAMADGDFFNHTNPNTDSTPDERATAAGYVWTVVAENIGQGYDTPEAVVRGWMESDEHRENILSPGFREIGVGYVYEGDDTYNCGDAPCYHYWTQNFGTREDLYPLVINGEAFSTDSPEVSLYIYGEEWAQEMRLSNNEGSFGEWEPFASTRAWTLPPNDGEHTVTVELRRDDKVLRSSNTIYLLAESTDSQPSTTQATPPPPAAGLPLAVPDVLSVNRTIDPPFLAPGQEAEVTIQVNGASLAECLGAPVRPLDVMLIYDISSSAGSGPGSNWEQTLDFTHSLIDQLTQPVYRSRTSTAEQSRLGMITSQTAVTGPVPLLLQELTQDYALARTTIESVAPGGDTDVAAGVRLAADVLSEQPPDRAQAIVLMLHDRAAIDEGAISTAAEVRGQGIEVYLIANNLNIAPEKQITTDIATALVEPENLLSNPQSLDLRRFLVVAAEGDSNHVATDVRIMDTYSPPGIVEISDISGPGGRLEGDKVIWDIPAVAEGETITLDYRVRLRSGAQGPMKITGGAAYIDCNGYLQSTIEGEQMQITPSATATPVEVPMVTPTPMPTETPQPGAIATSPPGPTPTPQPDSPLPSPTTPIFCTTRYWWVPGLLLPLLLALLIAFVLWWLARRTGFNWRYEWEQRTWRCRIPLLILMLYLFFLAFLVGRELTVGLCEPAEAVYFWRMAGLNRGVYLTEPSVSSDTRPVPFETVNREGCVGCHAVSSASGHIAVSRDPVPGHGFVKTLAGEDVSIPDIDPVYWGWSPDGSKLAFSSAEGDIRILDLTTNQVELLAGASDPDIAETMPAWSADGSTIAFVRSTTPLYFGLIVEGPCDIYTVPAEGGVAEPLPGASGDGFNYYPAYSPDGKWLAFTRHTTGSSSYADDMAEVYLVPAEGGEARRLAANDAADGTSLSSVSNSWPTWSRDGRLLAFNSKRDDPAFDVFITEIDEEGNSGPAIPLSGASEPGVFEHTPYWGEPIQPLPLWDRLLALWPWLLPLLPLLLLVWLLCRRISRPVFKPWEKKPRNQPDPVPPWTPAVTWDPGAAFVIGLGGSGRWILTHLKKTLLDAGSGTWPEQVRLLLLDTTEEEMVGGRQVPVSFAGVELAPEEKLGIAQDLSELTHRMYEDPEAEPEMSRWYPARGYQEHVPEVELDLARGTHQRRPLGRAGVFRHLHEKGEHSDLYRRLVQGLRAAKEPVEDKERASVVIVGSVAGGMGSATLCDVAYLVRQAATEAGVEGSVNIEVFLVAEGAFRSLTTDELLRVNSFAALREISRFQLSRGRPYPMIYRLDSPERSIQNDYCRWGLFDSVYVLDWAGFLSGERPEHGIFPATADILTVMLDRASRARGNALQPFRDGARSAATRAQARRGEAIMGTFGQLAYRLPFVDIIDRLKVRFGTELLREYLVGPGYENEDLILRKEQNREEAWTGDLHAEVMQVLGVHWYPAPEGPSPVVVGSALGFLAGLLGGGIAAVTTLTGWWLWAGLGAGTLIGAAVGAWLGNRKRGQPRQELYLALPDGALPEPAAVAAVAHARRTDEARDLMRAHLPDVHSNAAEAYMSDRQDGFRDYLLEVLAYILNGRSESNTIEARTGKLGYALAFLEDLRKTLETGTDQVQFLSGGFTSLEKQKAQTFQEMASALVTVVDEVMANLEGQAQALAGQREAEPGAYYYLLKRRQELAEHRKEMDAVQVRRYLWTRRATQEGQTVDQNLVDGYYRDYLADYVEPSLEQFHWLIVDDEDDRPHLQLHLRLDEYVPLDESRPESFSMVLQELGGWQLEKLWDRKGEVLAEVMTNDQLTDTNLPGISQTLHERSVPLASHDPQKATVPPSSAVDITAQLYQAKAFLYVNQNVPRRHDLAENLRRRMEGLPVEILPATDPFTCSLLQAREVVPLSAFDFYSRSENTYRTTHGIAERGRRASELGWREPPHVFPAERNALLVEQRLPEINEVPWAFHPLFVPALEDLERARAFALALLSGYLKREGGAELYRYRLRLPGERVDVALGWPEDTHKTEAQLVVAMRTFVIGQPMGRRQRVEEAHTTALGLSDEMLPGPYEVIRLSRQVRQALKRDREKLLEHLEALEKAHFIVSLKERRQALMQALPSYLREEAEQPGGRELIAFLRLVAKDKYRILRQKGKES